MRLHPPRRGDEQQQDQACGARRLLAPRAPLGDDPGADDAHLVQEQQRHHHDQHRHRIGRREQRRRHGRERDRVAAVPRQQLRRDEPQGGEDHDDQRQLGHHPEPDHDLRRESEIPFRGDDRIEDGLLESEQHAQRAWQHPQVGDGGSTQKQHDSGRQRRHDQSFLARVQRGRQKCPRLVDHDGRRQHEPQDERELEGDEERLGGVRELELAVGEERLDGSDQ